MERQEDYEAHKPDCHEKTQFDFIDDKAIFWQSVWIALISTTIIFLIIELFT